MPLGQLVRGVGAGGSTPLFHRVGATRDARRQTREDLAGADKLRVSEAFACALGAENIDLDRRRQILIPPLDAPVFYMKKRLYPDGMCCARS